MRPAARLLRPQPCAASSCRSARSAKARATSSRATSNAFCRRSTRPAWRSRRRIRDDLEEFFAVDDGESIELWAWLAAYDHVVLCQLWGTMPDLPQSIPRFTHELRQLWEDRGRPRLPPRSAGSHDALVDARDQLRRFQVITQSEQA